MNTRICVLMSGPDLDAKGGIAACAKVLSEHESRASRVERVDYVGLTPRVTTDLNGRALFFAIRGYLAFIQALARRPDIAHIHTSEGRDFWRSLPLVWAARASRVPVLLHIHSPVSFAAFLRAAPGIMRRLKLATVNLADLVIVPTESGKTALGTVRVSSHVIALPNPVNLGDYHPASLRERRQDLVYLGWLIPQKGIDDLLAILPDFMRVLPTARIHLCGPYGAQGVRAIVANLGLEYAVRICDWVEGDEKSQLLARARVLVLPSHSEGFGIVLVEAMASGTPCVATRVGGIPDVVADGVTGYLVEVGDRAALRERIERLFSDDETWERMSEAALVHSQRFDAVAVVTQLLDEYERIVTKGVS